MGVEKRMGEEMIQSFFVNDRDAGECLVMEIDAAL
jgi:hypothetical protein